MASGSRLPQRSCIACKTTQEKSRLLRVVRQADGTVALDGSGRAGGRGAYICMNDECLNRVFKANLLPRALRASIGAEALGDLRLQLKTAIAGVNVGEGRV